MLLALEDPCSLGVADARARVSEARWLALGCLGSFIAVESAKHYSPSPPPRVLELEPIDAVNYLKCFNEESRKIQKRAAVRGALLGIPLWLGAGALAYKTLFQ